MRTTQTGSLLTPSIRKSIRSVSVLVIHSLPPRHRDFFSSLPSLSHSSFTQRVLHLYIHWDLLSAAWVLLEERKFATLGSGRGKPRHRGAEPLGSRRGARPLGKGSVYRFAEKKFLNVCDFRDKLISKGEWLFKNKNFIKAGNSCYLCFLAWKPDRDHDIFVNPGKKSLICLSAPGFQLSFRWAELSPLTWLESLYPNNCSRAREEWWNYNSSSLADMNSIS